MLACFLPNYAISIQRFLFNSTRDYHANFITGFSDIKFEIKEIFGNGDKLTKHWVFTGKHTCEFFGVRPTGKIVTLEGSTIVRMQGGKIAKEQDFFDNMDLLTQLCVY